MTDAELALQTPAADHVRTYSKQPVQNDLGADAQQQLCRASALKPFVALVGSGIGETHRRLEPVEGTKQSPATRWSPWPQQQLHQRGFKSHTNGSRRGDDKAPSAGREVSALSAATMIRPHTVGMYTV